MRPGVLVVALFLCAACGKTPRPGKTPKETVKNLEAALHDLDVEAMYGMLSSRARSELDATLLQVKAALAAVPEADLETLDLGGLDRMSPLEILAAAGKRARRETPDAVEQLESMHLVVMDQKARGDRVFVKVSTLLNGRDTTRTLPLVREGGVWKIDTNEPILQLPVQLAPPPPQACVTFT